MREDSKAKRVKVHEFDGGMELRVVGKDDAEQDWCGEM